VDDEYEDPIEAARKIQERIKDSAAKEAAAAERYTQYRELWGVSLSGTDPIESLFGLAAHIKAHRHDFWIDLIEFELRRLRKASGTSLNLHDLAVVSAVGVLRAALARDRKLADSRAAAMIDTFQEGGFFSAFGTVRTKFERWELDREFPATPHMTTEELVAAMRGVKGFSRPTIFRMRADLRLVTDEPYDHLTRFRHVHPASHLSILHAVRNLFLKSPEFQPKYSKSHVRKRKSH
jgi:hypothetical protein